MAHPTFRVMVHHTVLNWHEQNVERDKKARDPAEEMDNDQAINAYVHVDPDWD